MSEGESDWEREWWELRSWWSLFSHHQVFGFYSNFAGRLGGAQGEGRVNAVE